MNAVWGLASCPFVLATDLCCLSLQALAQCWAWFLFHS